MDGESTISTDYLSINQVNGVPSGNSIQVNDETHVLIGFQEESLGSIGINTRTIRVFNSDRSIEYASPEEILPDYEVIEGTSTTPARIVRTSDSEIVNGSTVSVDYVHDENFTVIYVINDLLQQLQRTIDVSRHITADVVVKQAVSNSIEIETTVQLLAGATKDKTDPAIRSGVSLELNKRFIGQGIAQSDVINAIDSTTGVDFQVIPMARMAYADRSRKLREKMTSAYREMSSLNIGSNKAYILTDGLQLPTTNGGGLITEHKGVFQDDESFVLVNQIADISLNSRQAYIIGSDGAIIEGYTDVNTLISEGFITAAEQEAELLRRTANHVIVSLSGLGNPVDLPILHKYAVSYVVRGDSGSKDITSSGIEFVELGNFTITYKEKTEEEV
jgi:hypothetical protein